MQRGIGAATALLQDSGNHVLRVIGRRVGAKPRVIVLAALLARAGLAVDRRGQGVKVRGGRSRRGVNHIVHAVADKSQIRIAVDLGLQALLLALAVVFIGIAVAIARHG